jgi:beta-phosphoglucomutase-like phosphatase (HAD superfamily)
MATQGVRGVVFDLDGVLVDAADWHYAALNQALAPHGVAIGKVERGCGCSRSLASKT